MYNKNRFFKFEYFGGKNFGLRDVVPFSALISKAAKTAICA